MKKRVNHIWHDDWILENLGNYRSYIEAVKAYNRVFGVNICMAALKNHCRYKLGIRKPRSNYRHVTKEQTDWLRDIYPKAGVREATRMWNERYHDNASVTCIKQIARIRCDIQVDPDVAVANKLAAAHRHGSKRALREIGETRMECGRLIMKDEDGEWKSAGRIIWERYYGKIPEGYALVALDGNTANLELSNFEIVPWKYLGLLQGNEFFSSDPEITRAGIIWCDLKTVLKEGDINGGNQTLSLLWRRGQGHQAGSER